MKHYLLLLITLISALSFGQASGDVVFYSNSGEKFYVVMNGVRQNMAPETNVKVQGLTNQWYGCKIISSTNSFELEKNIPVKMDTLITYQIVGKKGKYKLRYFSETPMKTAPATGGQTIVNYSPVENTGTTTTNVGTTGTTTTNVGTTGTTTTTNVGTTGNTGTTGTTTTTNVGTTGVGTTTSVGTTGTTTTTTTTTGTTTGGDAESINININVSENGAGISMTGTGTGTETTNTSTTTTNNGNTTSQTTTSTTTGGNGTTTYYEETTTTTTSTGNIYQDPDVTFTMTTTGTGTGVGTTTTTGGTTTTTTNTGTNTNVGNTGTTTTNTTNYNNGNCYTSDTDFAAMKKSVSAETFEDDQMRVAKMATKGKCLTVKQIGELMKLFSFSEAQLEFAKHAYSNCANKSDYYQLMEIFTFSEDKEALESFINAQ